jgi:hypothetical protein
MENNSNRILNEINAWNQKVAGLKEVFGNHVTDYRYLVRAKLEHFKEINDKYRQEPMNKDEKIASKILKAEIRRLEKMAFPNPLERLIRKMVENIVVIVKNFRPQTFAPTQHDLKNEVIRKTNHQSLGNQKSLNKEVGQYNKNLKAVTDDELLPKLRKGNGKGLKM